MHQKYVDSTQIHQRIAEIIYYHLQLHNPKLCNYSSRSRLLVDKQICKDEYCVEGMYGFVRKKFDKYVPNPNTLNFITLVVKTMMSPSLTAQLTYPNQPELTKSLKGVVDQLEANESKKNLGLNYGKIESKRITITKIPSGLYYVK